MSDARPAPGPHVARAPEAHSPGPDGPEVVCSARGCRVDASWGLRWNNPRLHTPERRKVWLACDAHRGHLEEYLGSRGFLKDTVAVGELSPTDG